MVVTALDGWSIIPDAMGRQIADVGVRVAVDWT